MNKGLMSVVGLASNFLPFRRRRSMPLARFMPLGGVVPVAAYLLWQNRDKIRSIYNQFSHHQSSSSAAAA